MSQSDEVLDLDYDSPLESLFWFLGSPWCMAGTSLVTWFFFVSPGKNGAPAPWADFPVVPFFLIMLCLWGLGQWLKANYDVRYQLDSRTQQLNLVRKIFGQTFRSKVAEFSKLHAAGVLSTWSDDKQGNRSWQYALCLVTNTARIIRVSSYNFSAQTTEAAKVATSLGILNFPCQLMTGSLRATRGRDGKVTLAYKIAPRSWSGFTLALVVIGCIFLVGLICFMISM